MHGIVNLLVRAELRFDVLVAEHAHLGGEVLAVGAQEAAVEEDRGKEGHGFGFGAAGDAGGGCEEAEGGTHGGQGCGEVCFS